MSAAHEYPSIVCPKCRMESFSPEDICRKYCGNCQQFHSLMNLSAGMNVFRAVSAGMEKGPAEPESRFAEFERVMFEDFFKRRLLQIQKELREYKRMWVGPLASVAAVIMTVLTLDVVMVLIAACGSLAFGLAVKMAERNLISERQRISKMLEA